MMVEPRGVVPTTLAHEKLAVVAVIAVFVNTGIWTGWDEVHH